MNKFPFKRVMTVLVVILVYSLIFGVVGNCREFKGSGVMVANSDIISDQTNTSLDIYFNNNNSPSTLEQVNLWKAEITDYEVFNDYTEETTVTTTTTTLPQTVIELKPKTTQPQSTQPPLPSNPAPPHSEEITMTVKVGGQVVTLPAYDVLCSLVQQELNSAHIEALKAQAVASYTYYKFYEVQGN